MSQRYKLIDAVERNRDNPDTFPIPDETSRSGLDVGSFAKIGVESTGGQGERFWVEIEGVESGRYIGIVRNDLVDTDLHGLKDEDKIEFGQENVLNIEVPDPLPMP